MKSIKGFFDGHQIVPLEPMPVHKRYKVIITFTEELEPAEGEQPDDRDLHLAASGFDFWADEAEDIYQDLLPQTKPA
jgi:hypothetical protein